MATTSVSPTREPTAWPRWLNIAVGAWLFISAFLWPHAANAYANTWLVGLLIVAAAIVAMYVPWVRWLNTVFAVWLFFSTFAFVHAEPATTWNNAIVAIVVFVTSLAPGRLPRLGSRRMAHA
jgi:SPW repeat